MKHKEAVAVYMAFANALHDMIHAGVLAMPQVIAIMGIAQSDFKTLIQTGEVEMRGHDGEKTRMDGPAGVLTDATLDTLITEGALPEGVKITHSPLPTSKLN